MAEVVSPFLEEIIQLLDDTLCERHKPFAKLDRGFRFMAGLAILSAAGFAQHKSTNAGSWSWEPTTEFQNNFLIPSREPDFAPLVITGVDHVPDEVAQPCLEYAEAFGDLLRESEPSLSSIRGGFGAYQAGLVKWRRDSDGRLKWKVTKRGMKFMRKNGALIE